jgi:hypothetical protein
MSTTGRCSQPGARATRFTGGIGTRWPSRNELVWPRRGCRTLRTTRVPCACDEFRVLLPCLHGTETRRLRSSCAPRRDPSPAAGCHGSSADRRPGGRVSPSRRRTGRGLRRGACSSNAADRRKCAVDRGTFRWREPRTSPDRAQPGVPTARRQCSPRGLLERIVAARTSRAEGQVLGGYPVDSGTMTICTPGASEASGYARFPSRSPTTVFSCASASLVFRLTGGNLSLASSLRR